VLASKRLKRGFRKHSRLIIHLQPVSIFHYAMTLLADLSFKAEFYGILEKLSFVTEDAYRRVAARKNSHKEFLVPDAIYNRLSLPLDSSPEPIPTATLDESSSDESLKVISSLKRKKGSPTNSYKGKDITPEGPVKDHAQGPENFYSWPSWSESSDEDIRPRKRISPSKPRTLSFRRSFTTTARRPIENSDEEDDDVPAPSSSKSVPQVVIPVRNSGAKPALKPSTGQPMNNITYIELTSDDEGISSDEDGLPKDEEISDEEEDENLPSWDELFATSVPLRPKRGNLKKTIRAAKNKLDDHVLKHRSETKTTREDPFRSIH
jgi:hypothetical protein